MYDLTEFLNLLIKLVFSGLGLIVSWAVSTYVIPWIKSKLTSQQIKMVKDYIFTLIRSAEQMQSIGQLNEEGLTPQEAKKAYVLAAVKARVEKWGFTFDEEEISDLIEGLIKEAKNDLIKEA